MWKFYIKRDVKNDVDLKPSKKQSVDLSELTEEEETDDVGKPYNFRNTTTNNNNTIHHRAKTNNGSAGH